MKTLRVIVQGLRDLMTHTILLCDFYAFLNLRLPGVGKRRNQNQTNGRRNRQETGAAQTQAEGDLCHADASGGRPAQRRH